MNNNLEAFEIVEQDDNPTPVHRSKPKFEKAKKEDKANDTDKPAAILSKIDNDVRTQLVKDTQEILHGFHLNGRKIESLHERTKQILNDPEKVKLLLVKCPMVTPDGTDFFLMVKMFIKWGEAVFKFLGRPKPEGEYLVFIKDIKSGHIYMPCCHDVKPVPQTQLVRHFKECLMSKVDGSKCSFCNSTDLTSNSYTTVNLRKEHITQNSHINSIYLVLDYVKTGLVMTDVRISDGYLATRPFANYFLKNDGIYFGYHGLIEFLKFHIPTWQIERTPLYSMLSMYKRKAINSKKDHFKIPCSDCDCTFPTFTGFYLGIILGLETTNCQCGEGMAYMLPNAKIDELYSKSKEMARNMDANASKDILMALFGKTGSITNVITGANIDMDDLDKILQATKNITNTVVVSGDQVIGLSANLTSQDVMPKGKQFNQSTTMASPRSSNYGTNKMKKAVKLGNKFIKTTFKKNNEPAIPAPRYIAKKAGVFNNVNMDEFEHWWYDQMENIQVYDGDVHNQLIRDAANKFKKKNLS